MVGSCIFKIVIFLELIFVFQTQLYNFLNCKEYLKICNAT
ncbi:hypothetical protein LEP1GSC170_1937 [Leptospira interrogans serovar Bataviae str. HAI135]|nr:hypothetical protein LEP1GSC170_1937 [Leptospira interrogans serovar Bataviae str. HAI135]